jgi:predicted nucleotidyltransferase
MLDLKKHMPAITKLCQRYSVKRLSIYGSAMTRDFNRKSDVDFIVKYDRRKIKSLVDVYFGLVEDLEKHFKRPVDLMIEGPVRNPYLREGIKQTRKLIYEG